jgi:hypothetical protein
MTAAASTLAAMRLATRSGARDQRLQFGRAQVNLDASGLDGVEQPTELSRELVDQFGEVESHALHPPERGCGRGTADEEACRVGREDGAEGEIGVELGCHPLVHDHDLEHEREVGRQRQAMSPDDLQDIADRRADRDVADA